MKAFLTEEFERDLKIHEKLCFSGCRKTESFSCKIKDKSIQERIKKSIEKILLYPDVGKPLRYDLKVHKKRNFLSGARTKFAAPPKIADFCACRKSVGFSCSLRSARISPYRIIYEIRENVIIFHKFEHRKNVYAA